jgi:hypothetical protein
VKRGSLRWIERPGLLRLLDGGREVARIEPNGDAAVSEDAPRWRASFGGWSEPYGSIDEAKAGVALEVAAAAVRYPVTIPTCSDCVAARAGGGQFCEEHAPREVPCGH